MKCSESLHTKKNENDGTQMHQTHLFTARINFASVLLHSVGQQRRTR